MSRRVDVIAKLAEFDRLPNDAVIGDQIAAAVLGISVDTLRRSNPVPRRQISDRRVGRRVGDLRALSRGAAA